MFNRSIPAFSMPGTSFECQHRRRAFSRTTPTWESRTFSVHVAGLCKVTDRSVGSCSTEHGRMVLKCASWKFWSMMIAERAQCQATRSCGSRKSRTRSWCRSETATSCLSPCGRMTYSGRTLRRLASLRSSIAIKTRMHSHLYAWLAAAISMWHTIKECSCIECLRIFNRVRTIECPLIECPNNRVL